LYIVVRYAHLTSNLVQIMGFETLYYVVATLGIVLTLEATRRCVGLPIVIIGLVAIGYSTVIVGQSWEDFAVGTFFTSRAGIFGTPIQVSSTFIFLFLLFAVVLIHTNIGVLFNDLAFRLTGRFTGGPAKAAVAASGLQGRISGSSVANTAASGSFTIPLMKKAGFRPHFAGATEATASTGGQIMPPIMGAAASSWPSTPASPTTRSSSSRSSRRRSTSSACSPRCTSRPRGCGSRACRPPSCPAGRASWPGWTCWHRW